MPRKPSTHRLDSNHHGVVAIAKEFGWEVLSLTSVGDGCPDLLLWRWPQGFRLVEVKRDAKSKLKPSQVRFRQRYHMPVLYLRGVDEVRDVFKAITQQTI
jgi:hypothetical protein